MACVIVPAMQTPEPSTAHDHATLIVDSIVDLSMSLVGAEQAAEVLSYNVSPMRGTVTTVRPDASLAVRSWAELVTLRSDHAAVAHGAVLEILGLVASARRCLTLAAAHLSPYLDTETEGAF